MVTEALYSVIWFYICNSEPLLSKSNFSKLSKQHNFFFFQQRSFGIQGKASLLPLSLPLAVRGSCCHSLRSRSKLLTCLEMWILERERERDRDRQTKRQKKKFNKLYLTPEGIILDFFPCKKRRYNVQLQNFNITVESTFLYLTYCHEVTFEFIKKFQQH